MDTNLIHKMFPFVDALKNYHRHSVVGLEKIPRSGRALLVVNHSLATYDITLLLYAIYNQTGRISRPLADHLFFKIPYLGDLVKKTGGVEGTAVNASSLLESEELVAVAPGGMREALRPSSERYQILWDKRKGFAKLALETQTPIYIAVCPKADDIYSVYSNKLTSFAYKNFKVPLIIARGLGLSFIPKPVKLIHFISDPIVPPKLKGKVATAAQVTRFHNKIIKTAKDLIGYGVSYRDL